EEDRPGPRAHRRRHLWLLRGNRGGHRHPAPARAADGHAHDRGAGAPRDEAEALRRIGTARRDIRRKASAMAPFFFGEFCSLPRFQPANIGLKGSAQMTTLAPGYAAATQPVASQTQITTDTLGLAAGAVRVRTSDGELA